MRFSPSGRTALGHRKLAAESLQRVDNGGRAPCGSGRKYKRCCVDSAITVKARFRRGLRCYVECRGLGRYPAKVIPPPPRPLETSGGLNSTRTFRPSRPRNS
ncbi:SEC-C metal-binding domain-containing protein [Sphingobium yanoikuyae]|uniref:SEC-C metal-binding domain-containing protein n=1 Tax=Sphingobium yanoikuyae TaxID=13690 RepID=UPI000D35EA0E